MRIFGRRFRYGLILMVAVAAMCIAAVMGRPQTSAGSARAATTASQPREPYFQVFPMRGDSMEPALHDGQSLLTEVGSYNFRPIRRGDVIVFNYPFDPGLIYIKRVIALPGENVAVRSGGVYINGHLLTEPYVSVRAHYAGSECYYCSLTVPRGDVFVLGDNRNDSSDSHMWGVLSLKKVIGPVWVATRDLHGLHMINTPTYRGL